jgi:hypothetical protein
MAKILVLLMVRNYEVRIELAASGMMFIASYKSWFIHYQGHIAPQASLHK